MSGSYALFYKHYVGAAGLGVIAVGCTLIAILLRLTQSLSVTTHLFTGFTLAGIYALVWTSGGIHTPGILWIPLPVVVPALLLSKRAIWTWGIGSTIALLSFALLDAQGILLPKQYDTTTQWLHDITVVAVMPLFFALVLGIFKNRYDDALQQAADAREGVERRIDEAVRGIEGQHLYLAQSVDTMLSAIKRFAQGDLTIRIPIQSDDVIALMYMEFNSAVRNVNEVISQVRKTVDILGNSAVQISYSTEQINAVAFEQARQTTAAAESIEGMVQTLNNNLRSIREATQLAVEAKNTISESADTIKLLKRSSAEIGNFTTVINEIADRTNLLALNAAIEAARAGEYGKGFAVVADEVRKLAEGTRSATKEIHSTTSRIHSDTEQVLDFLKNITFKTEKVATSITDISTASGMQLSRAETISATTTEIAATTEESTATITNIANNSKDLKSQMDDLRSLVECFTTVEPEFDPGILQGAGGTYKASVPSMTRATAYPPSYQNGYHAPSRS